MYLAHLVVPFSLIHQTTRLPDYTTLPLYHSTTSLTHLLAHSPSLPPSLPLTLIRSQSLARALPLSPSLPSLYLTLSSYIAKKKQKKKHKKILTTDKPTYTLSLELEPREPREQREQREQVHKSLPTKEKKNTEENHS